MRVEVEDLVLDYHGESGLERALAGLSLSLERGESLSIVGPSGCGKTSLLYILAGLLKPSGGRLSLGGMPIQGPRPGTALVFQDYGLFPWKTAVDNVALGLLAKGMERAEAGRRARALLAELGIPEIEGKFPAELSGGQRQRLAIARALALEPELLLLDEPSSSLDAIAKESFQRLVLELYERSKPAMILVTHDIEEAAYLGAKIALMEKGRIVGIVDNPHFGDPGIRERMEFYELCLALRRKMEAAL